MDRAGEYLERKRPRTEVDDVDLIFLESNADPPAEQVLTFVLAATCQQRSPDP